MSLKTKKDSPRAMPVETIITRFKSAQLKRQLRQMDRSMSKVTQLLKTPKTEKRKMEKVKLKSPKKILKSPMMKKVKWMEETEIHPQTLKRKVVCKKIELKAKYELKMIGDTKSINKRKLCIPQRERKSPVHKKFKCMPKEPDKSSDEEYSVLELVEMEDSLDDEDFLEILTCPSPVWWEDPPDGYSEDSLSSSISTLQQTNILKQLLENHKEIKLTTEHKDKEVKNPVKTEKIKINDCYVQKSNKNVKIGEEFVKKSVKLEKLLDNIKNRTHSKTDEEKIEIENSSKNIQEVILKNNQEITTDLIDIVTLKDRNSSCSTSEDIIEIDHEENETKRNSTDYISDDEELIKNLEKINIPVESQACFTSESNKDQFIYEVPIVDIEKTAFDDSFNLRSDSSSNFKSDSENLEADSISITNIRFIDDDISIKSNNSDDFVNNNVNKYKKLRDSKVDTKIDDETRSVERNADNVEYVTIYKICDSTERKSSDTEDNVLSFASIEYIDSTSELDNRVTHSEINTNEKSNQNPLDPEKLENSEEIVEITEDLPNQNKSTFINEFKTSFPIESNNVKSDSDQKLSDCDNRLNSYYKKCKNAFKNKASKVSESGCRNQKSIVVSHDNVKYCLKCSSIFDTENCNYCVRISKSFCEFICDLCDFKATSKDILEEHLRQCKKQDLHTYSLNQT